MVKLQAKQCCESTLQLFLNNQTLPSGQVTPPLATPLPATSSLAPPSEPTSVGKSKKIVVISDPSIFNGNMKEKKVLYDHWLLQMCNKMTANKKMMPTKILKKAYVQSRVSSNALTQLKPRLHESNSRPFAMAHKMLDKLISAFGDLNRKQTAHTKYRTLQQGDWGFNNFWTKFQRLAAKFDHSKETLIDNLIKKCHYTIQ